MKYFTHLVKVNDKKYLLCFLLSLDGFNNNDIKEIKEFAYWLVDNVNEDVVFDYYFRNGHITDYNNRLFTADCLNHMHDISNNTNYDYDTCKKILKQCNTWWYYNLDLMFEWDQKHFLNKFL